VWLVAQIGEIVNTHKILIGTPERKRLLGRHKHRWEDDIKIVLQK